MGQGREFWKWPALAAAIGVPLVAAALSPLLQWRDPIYIASGFAGIVAMALLLIQPLLAGRYLPNLTPQRARQVHRSAGGLLVLAVVAHVGGLWITSPPDVVDALLFASPTQFSVWGVIAMWGIFATAVLASLRRRVGLRVWRRGHSALGVVIVLGSVIHAMLIQGSMETLSKAALCALVLAATAKALFDLRVFARRRMSR